VDQDGNVLAILVQRRRDRVAAKQFFRRLRKDRAYVPRVVSTDTLASDGAAKRAVLPRIVSSVTTTPRSASSPATSR